MYTVIFYEKSNGYSETWNFIEDLRLQALKSKDARIQFRQISLYLQLLQDNGRNLPDNIMKYLEDGIWELRPGSNRVLFFCFEKNAFVLLHHFRKKTQKTPRREIEKAKLEREDYIARRRAEK